VTAYIRIFGAFLLIALCAVLGTVCEFAGQAVYRAGMLGGHALMDAGEAMQDWAIEWMGVFD
jgi:hypothetical protein